MTLREQILFDFKMAMKNQDAVGLRTLRMLQAAVKNREIELRPQAISEDEIVSVLKKLVKQRKESIEQYQAGGRADLVQAETDELHVLEEYLPEMLSREELQRIVTAVIADLAANSPKQMGAVIKESISRAGGGADNKLISELVSEKLRPQG